MQFGDLALGQCDEADPGKAQPLEQRSDVLLVAAQAVERLGKDNVEGCLARTFQQGLVTRPQRRGAAQRGVTVDLLETRQPSRARCSRHSRTWSSIDAPDWASLE